jgi:DNA repair photolyase
MKISFVQAKSILNKSKLGGYTLNPYTGCPHGCVYCYNQHFIKIIKPEECWGKFLEIKINAPELLEKEITGKYKNKKDQVFFSTITDPYNPFEKQHQITRRCLEVLSKYKWSIDVLTKSDLVLRDLDIFKQSDKRISIGFTITTTNPQFQMLLEPAASLIEKRLEVLKTIKKQGISTYVFVAPILPFFTNLKQIFETLQGHVDNLLFDTLNTNSENWKGVEKVLKDHYPQLLKEYREKLFVNRPKYEQELKKEILLLSQTYKISAKILF